MLRRTLRSGRALCRSAGVRLSVIGLGTWQFGSREWGYGRDYADSTALDIATAPSTLASTC